MNIAYVSLNPSGSDKGADEDDNYAYEERQERETLLKAMHIPMKTWYQSSACQALQDMFGPFPLFWQELEGWEHHKQVRKLYLVATEKQESGKTVDMEELLRNALRNTHEQNSYAETDTQQMDTDDDPHNSISLAEQKSAEGIEADSAAGTEGDAEKKESNKRKRRSRWGDVPPAADNGTGTGETAIAAVSGDSAESKVDGTEDGGEDKPRRKSRWSTTMATTSAPNPLLNACAINTQGVLSQEAVQQTLVLQMKLKTVNERLMNLPTEAKIRELDPNRSPSPPPIYDSNGKRVNTREVRMRDALVKERADVIEQIMKLNPFFKPPADFVRPKPTRKLYIPYKEYPSYNFIGLIIGPRGNTQKRMEAETGCKISIRGKGSVKEGAKARGVKSFDDDDELHVYVQGETEDQVEKAAKIVKDLLTPVDDDKNEHKQKQLRELALINGTLRDDEYCHVCGEKGHRQYECPHRMRTFKAAGVKCAICGDSSHPTRDCPMKTQEPSNQAALDREYLSFMAELGDDTAKQHLETASTLATGAGPNVSYAAPIGMASAGSALATGPQQVSYAAPLPMPVPTLQYPWQQQQQQPVAPQPSPSMQQWPQPTSAYYAPAYPTVLPAFPQAQYAYPPMAPQPVGYVQPLPPPTYAPPPPPQS